MRDQKQAQPARTDNLNMRVDMLEDIAFHRDVMRLLGDPIHLNFWWSEREKMLLVGGTDTPTDKSVPVPGSFYTRKSGPRLRNRPLRRAIKTLLGGSDSTIFKLHGVFVPELQMIAFKMMECKGVRA